MKDTERHNYIGDHIRKLREEKGWTQQVLGKKLGKKTSTISAYETNAKLPSVDCLSLSTALLKWPNCSMYRLTHWFMGIVQI